MDFSPYAGRWIALTESCAIAGVGTTLEETRYAARAAWPKERLRLMWITPHPPHILLPEWPLTRLKTLLPAEGVWLVGGPVRDLLLGRELHDWDFAVVQDGRKLARAVADAFHAAYYPLDDVRDTGRVVVTAPNTHRPITLDFATLRGATLEEDLQRRDFTINAMALTLQGVLCDPNGGQADLDAGLIRMTGPSSFTDDPVRLLRAVRLANSLGFRLETHTEQAIRTQAASITTVAPERIHTELLQMLHDVPAARSLQDLTDLGLLRHILPEIWALHAVQQSAPHHYANVHMHTLATVAAVEGILALLKGEAHPPSTDSYVSVPPWTWPMLAEILLPFQTELLRYLETAVNADMPRADLLKWGALFHDVGKANTRSVDDNGYTHFYDHPQAGAALTAARLEALRFPAKAIAFVETLVAEHMRLAGSEKGEFSRRAIYRFYRTTGDAGVSVVLLALADTLAVWERELTQRRWRMLLRSAHMLLDAYFEQPTQVVAPPPLLNGYDVIALGIPQGPQVGRILETLREAQAAGEVTTREAAVALVNTMLTENKQEI
ncbi:MAG TPA: HD domain-containing protein [Anaerolineae bacterium]|nr:HD domain-containing protein [Anaerolineae bacterium]HQK14721.1 HD domain-containing protein [Anaerolineae bacterium]